jgi:hypothetical protein
VLCGFDGEPWSRDGAATFDGKVGGRGGFQRLFLATSDFTTEVTELATKRGEEFSAPDVLSVWYGQGSRRLPRGAVSTRGRCLRFVLRRGANAPSR